MKKIYTKEEYAALTRDERIEHSKWVIGQQEEMDWNYINYMHVMKGMPMSEIPGFRKFTRPMPEKDIISGKIINYRSHPEVVEGEVGCMSEFDYEPDRIPFVRTTEAFVDTAGEVIVKDRSKNSIMIPDFKIEENIYADTKAIFSLAYDDGGQKFLDFMEQTDNEVWIILFKDYIFLPWTVTNPEVFEYNNIWRKIDGLTMEEFCYNNRIKFCFAHEVEDKIINRIRPVYYKSA